MTKSFLQGTAGIWLAGTTNKLCRKINGFVKPRFENEVVMKTWVISIIFSVVFALIVTATFILGITKVLQPEWALGCVSGWFVVAAMANILIAIERKDD